MSARETTADIMLKSVNHFHQFVLRASGGRLLRRPFGMQTVELRTIGRKSGLARHCLLTSPVHDDNQVVLIASKGGDDRNPEWYLNLVANPDVEVVIDGTVHPMRARTASSEEKARLWPRITATYKGYANYQRRTDRDIPVVICEPRAG